MSFQETTRVVDVWADGHTGIGRSSDMLELGGTRLPDQLDPEVPTPRTANVEVEISREQFETSWRNAVKRVQWELTVTVFSRLNWKSEKSSGTPPSTTIETNGCALEKVARFSRVAPSVQRYAS